MLVGNYFYIQKGSFNMSKIMKTMDGNEAAAYASYAFTEVAGIFPITPSHQWLNTQTRWAAKRKEKYLRSDC